MADSVTTTYVDVVWNRATDVPGAHVPAVYVDTVWDRVEDIPKAVVVTTYIEVITRTSLSGWMHAFIPWSD